MITVKEFIQPDENLIKEIRRAERVCKKHDGLKTEFPLDASLNFDSTMKSVMVLYEGETLASILSIFAPTSDQAEFSAMTLPQFRQRGFFNLLYFRAVGEVRKFGVGKILLVCERDSDTGFEAVSAHAAKLDHTEYVLKFASEDTAFLTETPNPLTISRCTENEIETLASLSSVIFEESTEDAHNFVTHALETAGRAQYLIKLDDKDIGMVSVFSENGDATIYGVGLLPEYRGKGYGRQLLYLTIQTILKSGIKNIRIEVDSTNQIAYKLYTTSGFAAESTVDYYSKKI